MDQVRQIRYLVAPFFFFTSLLWGKYLDCQSINIEGLKGLWPVFVAAFFPVGFLISIVSHVFSWIIFWILTGQHNDVWLSDAAQKRVWKRIGVSGQPRRFAFYASATFDHDVMPEKVHQWVMRLWSACMISGNSAVALWLALVVSPLIKIRVTWEWWLTSYAAIVLLAMNAFATWRHCINMIELQSLRQPKEVKAENGGTETGTTP